MKNRQQQYGQFFTPNDMTKDIVEKINNFKPIKGDILEPSYGNGSFIFPLLKYNVNIDAFEIDEKIFKPIQNVNTQLLDFIKTDFNKKYDYIIGNPPYIELVYSFYTKEEQKEILNKYKNICSGRLNLTHIFLYKSFKMIKNDGIIAFLLPSSVLTSPYYKNIRMMIYNYFEILHVIQDVKFKNVAIKVSLLIIQKKKTEKKPYFLNYNNNFFICEKYDEYPKNINATFSSLGYKANIGEVVWNQHKELLSNNGNKILLYSTNIGIDNILIKDKLSSDNNKKQYISGYDIKYKNCIVMPRTIGKKIKYCLILDNEKYVFENHVLVITHEDKNMLLSLYKKLKNGTLNKYFQLFFNSSNLSIDELNNLPIPIEE